MSVHEAPSGFTFTLRKPEDVTERLRRPVAAKLMDVLRFNDEIKQGDAATLGEGVLAVTDDLNDLMVVALVKEWSADLPITVESLGDLPSGDYKAIRQAVAPFVWDMFPDFDVTPENGTPTTP